MRCRILLGAVGVLGALTACGGGPPPIPAANGDASSATATTEATAATEATAITEATATEATAATTSTVVVEAATPDAVTAVATEAATPVATEAAATTTVTTEGATGDAAAVVGAFLQGTIAETGVAELGTLVSPAYQSLLANGQGIGELLRVQNLPQGFSVTESTPGADGVTEVRAALAYETGTVERIFKLAYQQDTQQWFIADIVDPALSEVTAAAPAAQPAEALAAPAAKPADAPAAPEAQPAEVPAASGKAVPIDAIACEELRTAVASRLGTEVNIAEALFNDGADVSGTSCQLVAKGNGTQFKDVGDVALDLRTLLEERGWTADIRYTADGPTGSRTGFRKDNSVALVSAGWTPTPDVQCEGPIAGCNIAKEQQLVTVTLEVAAIE